MDSRTKIVEVAEVSDLLRRNSSNGRRFSLARGWFDVLRASHCRFLAEAKKQGGQLVVMVRADSDTHVTLLDQSSRAQLVAAIEAVDYVVVCDEAQAERLASSWRPAPIVDLDESCSQELVRDVLQRYRPA